MRIMANLTIAVDEQVLKRARIKALEQGTSVNAVLRSFLEQYVREADARKRAVREILVLSRASRAARGNRPWTRDELHDRAGK
jgi:hypothetical protein